MSPSKHGTKGPQTLPALIFTHLLKLASVKAEVMKRNLKCDYHATIHRPF
jgi:hypothetical protein